MLRTYLYTPHSVTIDHICKVFRISVDVSFVDYLQYRKFCVYHLIEFDPCTIYKRLDIPLYKDIPLPIFMCGEWAHKPYKEN